MEKRPQQIIIESEETWFPLSKGNVLLGVTAILLVLGGLWVLHDPEVTISVNQMLHKYLG